MSSSICELLTHELFQGSSRSKIKSSAENVEVSPIYEYFLLSYRRMNMAVLKAVLKSSHTYHLPLQQEI